MLHLLAVAGVNWCQGDTSWSLVVKSFMDLTFIRILAEVKKHLVRDGERESVNVEDPYMVAVLCDRTSQHQPWTYLGQYHLLVRYLALTELLLDSSL